MLTASEPKPRKARLAATLSLLVPGLGQVYAGHFVRGLGILFVLSVGIWLAFLSALVSLPTGVVPTLLAIGIPGILFRYVFVPWDAARLVRRPRELDLVARTYAWYVYVGFIIVAIGVPEIIVIYARNNLLEPYRAPTESMIPTLLPGERLYADKRIANLDFRRGDVVIYLNPRTETKYIKRIIGLPGDRIEIRDGQVKINDQPVSRREIAVTEFASSVENSNLKFFRETIDGRDYTIAQAKIPTKEAIKILVPKGEVFVLGDNRDHSVDSRHEGSLPIASIVGKPAQVWLSIDPDSKRIRWERIGTVLR